MLASEREKMLAGELYMAMDPELKALRMEARRQTRLYNLSTEAETKLRKRLLHSLFGKIGENAFIEPPFHCDYGIHIFAGDNLFMNFSCVILDCAHVYLGHDVAFGPHVQIYAATHPLDAEQRVTAGELAKEVTIGNRVWIGGNSVVCPGVTIGEDTTIGAGSVVTRSIPAKVFAAGNPCRVIREL